MCSHLISYIYWISSSHNLIKNSYQKVSIYLVCFCVFNFLYNFLNVFIRIIHIYIFRSFISILCILYSFLDVKKVVQLLLLLL
jgi:hypothetical protein